MPRDPSKTQKSILQAGYRLFFRHGYARVSMDQIAAEAGVTKRTLYYHHTSKDDLVAAVLNAQNSNLPEVFRQWEDPRATSADAFLTALFTKLAAWARTPRWTGSGFTRLTLELGDLPGHPARKAASIHKKAFECWLAGQLSTRAVPDAERAAQSISILIDGSAALALIHDDAAYIEAALPLARRVLTPAA
jgi:AcrR family transcriptional regulator